MVTAKEPTRRTAATDFRLAPAALAAWATATYLSRNGHEDIGWIAPVLWGGAAALGVLAWWGSTGRIPASWSSAVIVVCMALLGVSGVLWRAEFTSVRAEDGMGRLATRANDQGATVRATFEVVGTPRDVSSRFGSQMTVPANLHRLEVGHETESGSTPITVWWSGGDSSWLRHDAERELLSAAGTIQRAQPGRITLVLSSKPYHEGRENSSFSPETWRNHLRRSMSDRSQRLLDADVGALVMGMSYGDDSRLGSDARDAFRISGLTHLTAVSGSNVALVALVGTGAARLIRCPRTISLLVAVGAVSGFVALVGPEPSVLRASWMGILGAVGMTLGRSRPTMPSLWVSMIGLLILDPRLSGDVGFILSVLATLGILWQGTPLSEWLVRFCPRMLADTLSMSVVATIWCAPVVTAISGAVGVYTVVANLLVAPVVPIVTVVGLAATLTAPVSVLADSLTVVAGWAAEPIVFVGKAVASWPGASVPIGDDPRAITLTILASVTLVFAIFLVSSRQRTRLVNGLGGKV